MPGTCESEMLSTGRLACINKADYNERRGKNGGRVHVAVVPYVDTRLAVFSLLSAVHITRARGKPNGYWNDRTTAWKQLQRGVAGYQRDLLRGVLSAAVCRVQEKNLPCVLVGLPAK